MNKQAQFEKLDQVPGYRAEVNRRRADYVQKNWMNIEEYWTLEEQKANREAFEAKLKADLEAEYKAGKNQDWEK